ncbi:MAG: hypothetical protein ABJJ53_18515 [Sulfitobacter sp.]
MKNQISILALLAALAACSGGNPFEASDAADGVTDEDTGEAITVDDDAEDDEEGTGINRDGIPPGTSTPSPENALFRKEETGEDGSDEQGNGFATGISYNSADDTFTVDNLAFDGDSPYVRGVAVSSITPNSDGNGEFAVYEAPAVAIDPINGEEIDQFEYRAVYGVSRNRIENADGTTSTTPTTQFAIVRTGQYIDYGFGGFIYQRDNSVTLPTTLQARFEGKSGGLLDSKTAGELYYTSGDVEVNIDYDDFNDSSEVRGDGVYGVIYNRTILDLDGNDVTSDIAAEAGATSIPNVVFEVGPDVLDNNGDLVIDIQSQLNGEIFEQGKFYAIVAGDDPDEIVGVFVLENELGYRDTSGFIVYRDPDIRP